MRYFMLLFFLSCFRLVHAQDLVVTTMGDTIRGKVIKIEPGRISLLKAELPNGPEYSYQKSSIRTIYYGDGRVEDYASIPFNRNVKADESTEAFAQGRGDAQLYYKRYRTAGTLTLVTTVYNPLAGLIVAISTAKSKPKTRNFDLPDGAQWSDYNYRTGYSKEAAEMKRKKVWKNFGLGIAGWFLYYGLQTSIPNYPF